MPKAIKYCCLAIVVVWSVLPIYWLANMSFMFEIEMNTRPTPFFPQFPTDRWYRLVLGFPLQEVLKGGLGAGFSDPYIWLKTMMNSGIVALVTATIATGMASVAGYAFGRLNFRHKNKLLFGLLFSRTMPPVATIIPYFFFFVGAHMLGSLSALILVYLVSVVPVMVWVLMGYYAALPIEVERAARVDGCSRIQALMRVVFPMAAPGIATGFIFALMCYSEFMMAMILTSGYPSATVPAQISTLFQQEVAVPIMSAIIMVGMIVPIMIGLFFQRYIVQLRLVDPVSVGGM